MKIFISIVSLFMAASLTPAANQYKIVFTEANPPTATVTATIPVKDGKLKIHEYGAWNEKEGWATFIKNLTVKDQIIKKSGKLEWELSRRTQQVEISYRVEFPYSKPEYKWSAGPRSTAAFYDGKGLFLLARTLFIYGDPDQPTKVCFEMPDGWKASTPWNKTRDNCYESGSLEDLMNNVIVVGKHDEAFVKKGNFQANLIFIGYESNSSKLMLPVFESIIGSFTDLFDYKEKGSYLMVWFPDFEWKTGEGYSDSYAVVAPKIPREDNRVVWANTVAHETFHYWLGARIEFATWAEHNWFSEGVTTYYSNLVLIREGIISERQFLNVMQKHVTLYLNYRYRFGTPYKSYSLIEAGSHKSTYNAAIYDGGWTAALSLDILIREATNNKKSLDDVMKILYKEFALKNRKYNNDDLVQITSRVAGNDLSGFFEQYVKGKEMIPVEELLEKAGFNAIATIYSVHISVDEEAPAKGNAIRSGIMKGH